jgi:hypothetical protein
VKSGYVQFSTGKNPDYCPGKAKSCTIEAFKAVYAPE